MKSIHIIGSKISGGAERFYARLANSLSEQIDVVAINPPDSPSSRLLDPGIRQFHPDMTSNYNFFCRARIKKFVMKEGPCIVQTYMGRATRLTHVRKGQGVVHVARLGGYYAIKNYRHAHHLVGNTKGICDYLIKSGAPAETVHYIGNFVEPILPPPAEELASLRASLNIPHDAFVITCAARFHKNKGLPDLLDAFSKVWKNHPDARLILVGDGPQEDELKKLIEKLGLKDSVILPGWCDPRLYYHLADVLTSPSRYEPLGNTILEAWACRKPLIATRTQGAMELITPDEDGLITPLNDTMALTAAFERLIQDETLRASLAVAGEKKIQTHFNKQIITDQYLRLYEALLKNP